jgi:hypothetical protein
MASNISQLPLPQGNPRPAAKRKRALSNAQRQKRWRAKQAAIVKAAVARQVPVAFGRQRAAAAAVAGVAIVLTGLSLSHLAHGIETVTRCPGWESWCMAIGIDLAFIACEVAQLSAATAAVAKAIGRYTKPTIAGSMIASAILNGVAFATAAAGWYIYPAAVLGAVVPALIYSLSRVAYGLTATK